MRIGVDFDNTIVSYDELFYELARERGLIPPGVPKSKTAVRDHLRRVGQEPAWTVLQALAYGVEIRRARMFDGFPEFVESCRAAGVPLAIISHKTRQPYLGAAADLHACARAWIDQNDLRVDAVHFELTREAKLARIAAFGCTHFVDDLPEFLGLPDFPPGTHKILFDPHRLHTPASDAEPAASWSEVADLVLCPSKAA